MIQIVPAIDIIDGQCVRLTKGDYGTKKVYNADPVDVAKTFEDHGVKFLHLVDLDGARSKHIVNHEILQRIATSTKLKVDFGGGIKTAEDAKLAFESGASQINCGSIAVDSPSTLVQWIEEFGPDKVILSADTRNGQIATHGWIDDSGHDITSFVSYFSKRELKFLTCTDIESDGMLAGPNFELYRNLRKSFPEMVITASGGITSIDDIKKLDEEGIDLVIIGKAIYEGRLDLKELADL